MDNETLMTLTADIVSAHISNNSVAAQDLPSVIAAVFGALSQVGQVEPVAEIEALEPAVSIRSSVKPDAITCLECGRKLKMLKRHLTTDHNLTPQEYRARWGLRSDYPIVASDYAETRKKLAVKIGLGRTGAKDSWGAAKPAAQANKSRWKRAIVKDAATQP